MKKNLLIHYCCPVLLILMATFTARATVTVNSTNFPDDNFRREVAAAAGVSENGGTFAEASLTTLDVSGKSITNLTGLGLLTGLTYLDISNNTTLVTGADITTLRSLTTVKASNCNLVSLQGTTGTSSVTNVTGPGLIINFNNASITYLDISYNANFYSSANLKNLTNLVTLDMNHCTNFDFWGTPGTYLENLEYVDVSYCTNMDRIYLPAATRLEVLKAAGLPKLKGFISRTNYSSSDQAQYYIALKNGLTTLKWLDVSDCSQLTNIYLRNCTGLKHVNASGTKIVGFSSSASISDGIPTSGYIQLPTGLTTLEYLNLANCTTMNSFRAIKDTYNISCLDTLILTNDTHLGWSNHGIEAQTGMTYLDVTNCDISTAGPDYIPNFDNLKSLETLLYGENPNVGYLRLTGNSNLKVLDLHGDTGLTMLALDNCGLPRTNLSIDDTNCPALTGLKLNNNGYASVSQAMGNATTWGLDNIKFLYLENNSGFTGGPLTLAAEDCYGLTGLDLGRNGFTSFTAPELPNTLTALMLGDNTSMTRLEMHNNPGITKMAADTVMYDGSGLYLLGNTALKYMDISGTADQPNHFQHIGNNFSFAGLSIDTIKASHNKFYTFRNLTTVPGDIYETCHRTTYVYGVSETLPNTRYYYSAFWPTMEACPDSASVEQLTGLKYLDLSYCQLKDSVYLHKNTDLRYLDVSHNRTIKRYTSSQDKGADYRASIPANNTFNRNYPDYKKYLWLVDTRTRYPYRQEAYDQEYYTLDYNDTIGLYILDLMDNVNLEYLDVSYTGIEQTALTHCHVSNARFMWIQDLHKLKYLCANYNGMRSMGIGTLNGKHYQEALKSLERLSVIGMRGADITTMQGSMNFHNNGRNPHLHYVNVSYSDYDSIGVKNPAIDTLIVRGNPIHHLNVQEVDNITYIDARECAFKERGYDPETNITVAIPDTITQRFKWTNYNTNQTYDSIQTITMNGARSNGMYSGELRTPWSGLRTIEAHDRQKLTTLLVNNSNALRDVYCYFDPVLPKITGFDDLAYPKDSVDQALGYGADTDSLKVVWVNDDASLIELDLHKNVNLQYLHAYNDKALGTALGDDGMLLNENTILKTAWVSNSLLKKFVNNATTNLDTLMIWDNPKLKVLDVAPNTKLRYLDLRNCQVRYLNVSNCDSLEYFDCSNDSIKGKYFVEDWFGYDLPKAVPVPYHLNHDPDGKNSIADLMFKSKKLRTVKADNNDLFSLKGLNDNDSLRVLTYSHNHINAIDLSGCDSIKTYNFDHNGRGAFPAEYAKWLVKNDDNSVDTCHMYYLQLDRYAGDELDSLHYDSYLGFKWGFDSLENEGAQARERKFDADGFKPKMVACFDVNAKGPYHGNRGESQSPRGQVIINTDSILNPDLIYGDVVVLDITDNPYNPGYHYIEYEYYDGRRGPDTRDPEGPSKSRYYMVWYSPGEATEVEETLADDLSEATVASERYFDINGRELNEPANGVTIIVKQMSDGSTQTVKVMK